MKSWIGIVACFAMGAWAQDVARPQVPVAAEADYNVATYLAQGPTPWSPAERSALRGLRPDVLVASDGSGNYTSLQAALDAVPAANAGAQRVVIGLAAGIYRGQVCLRGKVPVTLIGLGSQPADVRIVASRYAAQSKRPGLESGNPCMPALDAPTYGTFSSATLALFSNEVQLVNLAVENDAMNNVRHGVGYPAAAAEAGGAQAVALMTQGDKIQLENVHLLGHQDTLYVRAALGDAGDRVYVRHSLVAGDVDFIFGAGTLVIDDSTILSRGGRRAPGEGGHVLAPSTAAQTRLGMLVTNSRWISEAGLRPGSVSLGRAWDQGVAKGAWQKAVSPNGQAVVRDSVLGSHIGPWAASTSRRPFSPTGEQANRLLELHNQQSADGSREILAPQDGWAAAQGGTWGGAQARLEHVYTVRNRSELVAALAPGEYPRVVHVAGRIDLSTDAQGRSLGFEDYRDPAFDPKAFALAYDPATWGKKPPAGIQEEARQRSAQRQSQQVVVKVPSHTTIVGQGSDAAIVNGGLALDRVDNVIIRNIHFSDAYDYFPAWDPKDNANGEWNSEYDNLSLRGATHVWVDHCTFDDGPRPDHLEPVVLGRQVQHHDGLLDISHQSNWVTVTWNHFRDHDKTSLVGGSDAHIQDAGKLKVTFHHNWYQRTKERTPRVRYGDVHVYNNLFDGNADGGYPYAYSLGLGLQSRIYSERNVWLTPPNVRSVQLLRVLKGNRFADRGSIHNGVPVDLLSELRVNHPSVNWADDVGWTPSLFLALDNVSEVQARVQRWAGAGRTQAD